MTQNEYITAAKLFIKLYPREEFPLRMSKMALPKIEGLTKNMLLAKHSPFKEPFSVIILRLFQSGICDHFMLLKTSINFHRNPNVRTAEQDWNQIISMDILKLIFRVLFIFGFLFPTLVFALECFEVSLNRPTYKCNINAKQLGRKIPFISIIQSTLLTCFCFIYISYYHPGTSGISYSEFIRILTLFSILKAL